MKKIILPISFALFFCVLFLNSRAQAVSQQDSLALVDFYHSTHGEDWIFNAWDLNSPVSQWNGVTVENGRVTGITLRGEFRDGKIMPSFGDLTELKSIYLLDCRITDTLPAAFANLTKLTSLNLDAVFYEQPFSNILTKLINLETLSLTPIILTDSIPSTIGNLIHLKNLDLSSGTIGGNIPEGIGNLVNLEILNLNSSNLSGPIPASFNNLTKLKAINLSENKLSGEISESLINLPDLEEFFINDNGFTFQGIEALAQRLITNPISYYSYIPQANIPITRQAEKLLIAPGGTPENNTIEWFKVGGGLVATLQGETEYIPQSFGYYYARVTNSVATELILGSDTIRYNFLLTETSTSVNTTIVGTDTIQVNEGVYKLLSLKPVEGSNALNGNVNITVTINNEVSTFQDIPYLQRHFDITPETNPGSAQAIVTLYYPQQDFDAYNKYIIDHNLSLSLLPSGGIDNGNLRITQYHGTFSGIPKPENYSGSSKIITPNVMWDADNQWWIATFFADGFSGFFVNTSSVALPVTLVEFSGLNKGNEIILHWISANETATKDFIIERGMEGVVFERIGTVAATSLANGGVYSFKDITPASGLNFYRLKMTDKNGSFSYSPVIKVNFVPHLFAFKVYPNPAVNSLKLQFTLPAAEKVMLEITDVTGKHVLKSSMEVSIGTSIIPLDIQKLRPGMYYLQTQINGHLQKIAFVKN